MNKFSFVLFLFILSEITGEAQILATFENENSDRMTLSDEWYEESVFSAVPGIYANPSTTGINSSAKCFGAINVANADWWGNFVKLDLNTPITITQNNRYLSFMLYRSIQPKSVRLGFNGREENHVIFEGNAGQNATWEKITIDLYTKHKGKELKNIWIIFSCNWSNPRNGWGKASYYFDNFELSGQIDDYTVTINPSVHYQTIEGFSASDCWTGNFIGQWNDSVRNSIAKKLFSSNFDKEGNPQGIGLSMWRFNLGAGTYEQGENSGISDISRRAECFLNSSGNYDWHKQAGQQYFLKKAQEYGCKKFVAFSNSPLTIYTKNGLGYANTGETCNLKKDNFDDYANYITTVLKHFSDKGINFSYISPVNEPQFDWTNGQEGSPWTNSDIKKITQALNTSILNKKLDTKILLSEAASWKYLYRSDGRASNQIYEFFDPSSNNYIGNLEALAPIIGGHSYWTFSTNSTLKRTREAVKNAAKTYNIGVFQTEWSLLNDAPSTETGFPADYDAASYMDIALFMAKVIQSDMAFANASSWSYWTAMDQERWSQKNRFFLIRVIPSDGASGSILNSGTAKDSPTLWALGNFSLFIRPGAVRIKMEGADKMNELFGTAYLSADSCNISAVYVNTSYSDINVNTSFQELNTNITSIRKYITKENTNLKRDKRIEETYPYQQTIQIPARSVTTIIYKLSTNKVHDTKQNKDIQIFPNPISAGKELTIFSSEEKNNCNVECFSINSKILFKKIITINKGYSSITIPSEIPQGLYLLKIETNTDSLTRKICIQ